MIATCAPRARSSTVHAHAPDHARAPAVHRAPYAEALATAARSRSPFVSLRLHDAADRAAGRRERELGLPTSQADSRGCRTRSCAFSARTLDRSRSKAPTCTFYTDGCSSTRLRAATTLSSCFARLLTSTAPRSPTSFSCVLPCETNLMRTVALAPRSRRRPTRSPARDRRLAACAQVAEP